MCQPKSAGWRPTHIFCVYVSKFVNEGRNQVELRVFIGKFDKIGGVNVKRRECRAKNAKNAKEAKAVLEDAQARNLAFFRRLGLEV